MTPYRNVVLRNDQRVLGERRIFMPLVCPQMRRETLQLWNAPPARAILLFELFYKIVVKAHQPTNPVRTFRQNCHPQMERTLPLPERCTGC